ncbi:MAG: RtcB family protein [Lachnospiraceae bacterium]|nr:RtcB family protein [Lachnospiraceae bacterium]
MKIINGVYTSAKIFTTTNTKTMLDDYAAAQIQMLCDNIAFSDSQIRIMPDVHPGKVGPIGFTATFGSRVLPNIVGIDIGCGITIAKIKQRKIEFQKLDAIIRDHVPSGFYIRKKPHHIQKQIDLSKLHCYKSIREKHALLSLGTLGGGNHFIEIDQDEEGNLYVVIHSGSRNLGKEVAEYYLSAGQQTLKNQNLKIPYELTYLEGELMSQYLHDIEIVQNFASLNRDAILNELVKRMKWKVLDSYSCQHNYVETNSNVKILRKGAISAKKNERVIIPINMHDGIILGTGKGNEDWNYSAPHGSGRVLKREDVKSCYTLSHFKSEMKGIYSSCIRKDTLDEAPFAYRELNEIADAISNTVKIEKVIRPIYNFKAGSKH